MNAKRVAIIGANTITGETLRSLLDFRDFPISQLVLADQDKYEGQDAFFRKEKIKIIKTEEVDFKNIDIAFFCAQDEVSVKYAKLAASCGAFVIDRTSTFSLDLDVPLIVPEINAHLITKDTKLVSSPNCTSVFLALGLWAIEQKNPIKRVVFSTYQAVSGAGRKGFIEMTDQVQDYLKGEELKAQAFLHPIAFNVIPQIGDFDSNGDTQEEIIMEKETMKILNRADLKISGTCVRVPTLRAHSISLMVELTNDFNIQDIKTMMQNTQGLKLMDEHSDQPYPMPLYAILDQNILVGRIRKDRNDKKSVQFWVVSDQLLKGTALNQVQIAEHYITL